MPRSSFVPDEPFESYRERFSEHFIMERDARGVLEVRMHTDGGTAIWGHELHRAIGQMFQVVGADRENEVLIFGGSGDHWLRELDNESFDDLEADYAHLQRELFHSWYHDGMKLLERPIWDIDIPTIGVLNGPGFHWELAVLCDITICAEDARLFDPHLAFGLAPGDGQFLVWQHLIGPKRANYAVYMVEGIDAERALDWGLVNEVLPRDQLAPRAREIAAHMLEIDPTVRRITSHLVKHPWRPILANGLETHFAHEMWGALASPHRHSAVAMEKIVDP